MRSNSRNGVTMNFQQEPYNPMHRNIYCMANLYCQITNIVYLYLTIWLTYTILTLWLTESKTWQRNPILVGYRIIRQFADSEQFRTIHHKSYTLLILHQEYCWIFKCNVSLSDWLSKARYPIGWIHSLRSGLKVINRVSVWAFFGHKIFVWGSLSLIFCRQVYDPVIHNV